MRKRKIYFMKLCRKFNHLEKHIWNFLFYYFNSIIQIEMRFAKNIFVKLITNWFSHLDDLAYLFIHWMFGPINCMSRFNCNLGAM